jgi:hypothetical protein
MNENDVYICWKYERSMIKELRKSVDLKKMLEKGEKIKFK